MPKRITQASSRGAVVPANWNSPDQIVISGERMAVARALDLAMARGARKVIQLRVGGAFSFEKGWDGWISELENQGYVQFNSSHESFTRFEIEPDGDGTLFHLIDKLPGDFVMEVGSRQDNPIEDSDTEKMRLVEYNQPGGTGRA